MIILIVTTVSLPPKTQGPHQEILLQCNRGGVWSWPRFLTRESPEDTVSDVKVQEEQKTYMHSKRLMQQDQGLQPIPLLRDNILHIPMSSPLNTPTPSTSLTLPSFIVTQRSCRTPQYLLPTAYLASIIRWPGSSCCVVPQMGSESMSLLGLWGKESSMQCVHINVIMREFVLARHLPDHEDVVHQRRGKELGGESKKLDMLREKFPQVQNFLNSYVQHVM